MLYCTFRYVGSLFDSLVTGDIAVHNKFTGIHIMDLHPLAGLASILLHLETSFKSSAAEGRTGGEGKGKEKEMEGKRKSKQRRGEERWREGTFSYNLVI